MAHRVGDRAFEQCTGTNGNITTTGAIGGGYVTLAAIITTNGDTADAVIWSEDNAEWEVVRLTRVNATTFSRGTPYASSNGGSTVNFTAGNKFVWIDTPAPHREMLPWTQYASSVISIGANRATNPVAQFDFSAGSVATGFKFTGAAAAGRAAIAVISSGTNEGGDINAKGTGTIRIGNVSTGNVILGNTSMTKVDVPCTTAATSTTTGAMTIAGGLGVAGRGYFGGPVLVNGADVIAGLTPFVVRAISGQTSGMFLHTNDYVQGSVGTGFFFNYGAASGDTYIDMSAVIGGGTGNGEFRINGTVKFPGVSTTASAANAFLDSGANNNLLRSTSSLRYKRDVHSVDLNTARSIVMALRPITYRSRAEADDQRRVFFGLGAEDVADVSDSLVHLVDDKPDGVMYDRVGVLGIKMTQDHERRLAAIERQLSLH